MRLGGFASRLGVQVSTMSRIVDIMAASGWLERRPDEADHRACVIAITSAGSALLDAVRQDGATRLATCVARLGPDDLAVLEAALPVLESLAQQVASRQPVTLGAPGLQRDRVPDAAGSPAVSPGVGREPSDAWNPVVIGGRGLPGENVTQLARVAV